MGNLCSCSLFWLHFKTLSLFISFMNCMPCQFMGQCLYTKDIRQNIKKYSSKVKDGKIIQFKMREDQSTDTQLYLSQWNLIDYFWQPWESVCNNPSNTTLWWCSGNRERWRWVLFFVFCCFHCQRTGPRWALIHLVRFRTK